MKTPALTILSLLLPILLATASESKDLKDDFGIDLKRDYSGMAVQAMLEAAAEEADGAIEEAYEEGYKAGLLEATPKAEYWKSRATEAEAKEASQAKLLESSSWKVPAAGAGGFALGLGLSLLTLWLGGLAANLSR